MVRQFIIVAGNSAHLYEHLKRGFPGNGTVRVPSSDRSRWMVADVVSGTGSAVIRPAPISGLAGADSTWSRDDSLGRPTGHAANASDTGGQGGASDADVCPWPSNSHEG